VSHDRWVLGLSGLALVFSFLLTVDEGGDAAWSGGTRLPGMCPMKNFSGVDCPGCGLTRSFILLSRGRVARAAAIHLAGPFLYALAWLQIPYRTWALRRRVPPAARPRVLRWMDLVAIVTLLVGWAVRLAGVA